VLQDLVGATPLWPAIKANAYGHGLEIVARHLIDLGYTRLCVGYVCEAVALLEAGVSAKFVTLSATLPEHARALVASGCEPVVCTLETVEALAREATKAGSQVAVHVMVDTGMGRIGIRPDEAVAFIEHCRRLRGVHVRGLMSHLPRADEADKTYSAAQLERFREVVEATRNQDIEFRHFANSAAIFDVPGSSFDAARPGISIYGLRPSADITNPRVTELKPVLHWKTRVTFLKEVPPGTGLSYGHAFHTRKPSLIATVPVGYGDGLNRGLSNRTSLLVHGVRCPQVGRITMDQCLIDVTALRGQVGLGDEVVIIGSQGGEQVSADELAEQLDTINYEVVTGITERVPRVRA